MDLELGIKITRNKDDLTSTTNLRIVKDSSAPIFYSEETDTMFLLIAHLKGFRENNIDIGINQSGDQIVVSGKKLVQKLVLSGLSIMRKKEVGVREFEKTFWIPDGVILDKIKARFNEEESRLRITMPKSVEGIIGVQVEEVKQESVDNMNSESNEEQQIAKSDETEPGSDNFPKNKGDHVEPNAESVKEREQFVHEAVYKDKIEATQLELDVNMEKLGKEARASEVEKADSPHGMEDKEIEQIVQVAGYQGQIEATKEITEELDKREKIDRNTEKAGGLHGKEAIETEVKKTDSPDDMNERNSDTEQVLPTPSKHIPDENEKNKALDMVNPPIVKFSKEIEQWQTKEELPSEEASSKEIPKKQNLTESIISEKVKQTDNEDEQQEPMEGEKEKPERALLDEENSSSSDEDLFSLLRPNRNFEIVKDLEFEEETSNDSLMGGILDDNHEQQNPAEAEAEAGSSSELVEEKQCCNKICVPLIVVGSAILASLIGILHFMRPRTTRR
ncbi:hypothetical protein ACFE04_025742 [Oxalis oulophora]